MEPSLESVDIKYVELTSSLEVRKLERSHGVVGKDLEQEKIEHR